MSNREQDMVYVVEPEYAMRVQMGDLRSTGIFVRAKLDGHFGSYDIAALDDASLEHWFGTRLTAGSRLVLVRLLLGHRPAAVRAPTGGTVD